MAFRIDRHFGTYYGKHHREFKPGEKIKVEVYEFGGLIGYHATIEALANGSGFTVTPTEDDNNGKVIRKGNSIDSKWGTIVGI